MGLIEIKAGRRGLGQGWRRIAAMSPMAYRGAAPSIRAHENSVPIGAPANPREVRVSTASPPAPAPAAITRSTSMRCATRSASGPRRQAKSTGTRSRPKIFDPTAGVYGRWFVGAHLQHLLQRGRSPCAARPRRPERHHLRLAGRRSEARDHLRGTAGRGEDARRRAARISASATRRPRGHLHADGAGGGGRHAGLRAHRARSIPWCSAASPRPNWPPASTMRKPKVIVSASAAASSPAAIVAYKPLLDAAIALSPHKPRSLPDPAARRRRTADLIAGPRPRLGRRREARQGRAPPTACRSRRPIRCTSSTPPAPPAGRRAWCATMAATRWR